MIKSQNLSPTPHTNAICHRHRWGRYWLVVICWLSPRIFPSNRRFNWHLILSKVHIRGNSDHLRFIYRLSLDKFDGQLCRVSYRCIHLFLIICCYLSVTSWTQNKRFGKFCEKNFKKTSKISKIDIPEKGNLQFLRELDQILNKRRLSFQKWLRLHVFLTKTAPLKWMPKLSVPIFCIDGIQRAGLGLLLHSFFWSAFLHVRFNLTDFFGSTPRALENDNMVAERRLQNVIKVYDKSISSWTHLDTHGFQIFHPQLCLLNQVWTFIRGYPRGATLFDPLTCLNVIEVFRSF